MTRTTETASAQVLLQALAAAIGHALSWNDEHECVLEFEGAVQVVLHASPGTDTMSVRADLSDEDVFSADRALAALRLNYGRLPPGFAIAMDPQTGRPVLLTMLLCSRVAADDFVERVDTAVALVPLLRVELHG